MSSFSQRKKYTGQKVNQTEVARFFGFLAILAVGAFFGWSRGYIHILPARAVGSNYYVDQHNPACSDSGSGSQEQPFCTVKHTQVVAQPGDTFYIADGMYGDPFGFTVSGTAEAPISYIAQGDNVILGSFVDIDDTQFVPTEGYSNVYQMEVSADFYTYYGGLYQTHYAPIDVSVPDTDTAFTVMESDGPIPLANGINAELSDVQTYEGSVRLVGSFGHYFLYVHPYGNVVPSAENTNLVAAIYGSLFSDSLHIMQTVGYLNFDGFKVWYGPSEGMGVYGHHVTMANMHFTTGLFNVGDSNTYQDIVTTHRLVRHTPASTWLDDTEAEGKGLNLAGGGDLTLRNISSFHNTVGIYDGSVAVTTLEGGNIHGSIQSCVKYGTRSWSEWRGAVLYNCGQQVYSGTHSQVTYENLTLDSGPVFQDWWNSATNHSLYFTNDIFNGCAIEVEEAGMTQCGWENSSSITNSIFLCDNPAVISIPHCLAPDNIVYYHSVEEYLANCGSRCMTLQNVSFVTTDYAAVISGGKRTPDSDIWNVHISGPASPARNTGASTADSHADYEGDLRPQGGDYDIGADEFTDSPDNRAPEIQPLPPVHGTELQLLEFTLTATDADRDTVTFEPDGYLDLVGATLTNNGDNTATFSWTPGDFDARDYIRSFIARDPSGAYDSQPITIIIAPDDNLPPIIDPIGDQTIRAGQNLDLLITVHDPDGDPVHWIYPEMPPIGHIDYTNHTEGIFRFQWNPGPNVNGEYQIIFGFADNEHLGSSETVTFRIDTTIPGAVSDLQTSP